MQCPICHETKSSLVTTIQCGKFDGSTLYEDAKIHKCESCLHVYNALSMADLIGLGAYYENEYAPVNHASRCQINPSQRDEYVFELVASRLGNREASILNIGVATYGLVKCFLDNGYLNTFGVERIAKYIQGQNNTLYGKPDALPVNDGHIDAVIINHELEHAFSPRDVLNEVFRVLKDNGIACISVPLAPDYQKTNMFPFYWFIMREHIQHFSTFGLCELANRCGFRVTFIDRQNHELVGGSTRLPSLTVILSKSQKSILDCSAACVNEHAGEWVLQYIASSKEHLAELSSKINTLGSHMACWGVGREFLCLYANTDLRNKDLMLIDTNSYKILNLTVSGIPVVSPDVLSNSRIPVFITSAAHADAIRQQLTNMKHVGCVMDVQQQ